MNPKVRTQNLRDFTVQIRHASDDRIVGTGIAVSLDGKIVTCAHVVRDAGVDLAKLDDGEVGIYFPQARGYASKAYRAKVAASFPDHDDDDVILLQLVSHRPPLAKEQLPVFGSGADSIGNPFSSYGYPELDKYQGNWAQGTIVGEVEPPSKHCLQANLIQLESSQIDQGMSGAAVLDTERNLVVGIVSQTHIPNRITTKNRDTAMAVNARVLALSPLNLPVQNHASPSYTETDLRDYLQAVIDECDTIRLPYAQEGEASLPLERIYVALRADRSSPVERRASNKLFQQLVREREAQAGVEESVIYQIAILNPYAARYLLYDELRAELLRREEEERTYHFAEIVRTHRWLVLLGHPGSGKSTLARWLALQLARAVKDGQEKVTVQADHVRPDGKPTEVEGLGMARLPVLVRIADYTAARWQKGVDNDLPLRRYLGRHISQLLDQPERKTAIYALLDDYLTQGRVSFILDGLDEVTDQYQRHEIAAQIENLIRDHVCDVQEQNPLDNRLQPPEQLSLLAGNQLIVTSRIVGYQLRPLHENLPHFVIQPMDETAVRRFCDNWVAATQLEVEGEVLADAVLKHSNPYVKEQMGRNPLLLTILAQVFSANPQEGLPARRTQLYRQAKEAVFQQRPTNGGGLRKR